MRVCEIEVYMCGENPDQTPMICERVVCHEEPDPPGSWVSGPPPGVRTQISLPAEWILELARELSKHLPEESSTSAKS
jgi:hypothetical protein